MGDGGQTCDMASVTSEWEWLRWAECMDHPAMERTRRAGGLCLGLGRSLGSQAQTLCKESAGRREEDFHECLKHQKISTVRPVVNKSIDKHPWGPSGHNCYLPSLVKPLHSQGWK